jgi:acetolactate synthase-1/2/3 large subunit
MAKDRATTGRSAMTGGAPTGHALTGGQLLVRALRANGAELAFCVPGESYLPVLDALYEVRSALRLVVCRQEGGAAYMAEAYGKLTGRPGIAFVTRGPGASNACVGVHTARQDSSPMILFVGQVGSDFVDREAFQEVDYRRMYAPIAKWAAQIDRADRVPEYVARAYQVATSGRPGPVVLALPEDMLDATARVQAFPVATPVTAYASPAQMARVRELLAAASQPLLLLGGSGWTEDACADVRAFAERFRLPVACAFRNQDLFDNRHPQYCGEVGIGVNPRLAARVREADLLLVLGERLGEMVTGGYELLSVPCPSQKLVHVHPGESELGTVYQAELAIQASMPAAAAAFAALEPAAGSGAPPGGEPRWATTVAQARREYLDWQRPRPVPGPLDMWKVMELLRAAVPEDTIFANGAGNYSAWLHRLYPYPRFRTQLAPYSGSMGYGVPAAIAAKLAVPARTVVSFNGDGCFLMNGQELATAVQYDAAVLFIVVNNGMYGTIRMHQERRYPARVHGTDLRNPDFARLAEAYGAHGETVAATPAFAPALERALAATRAGRPALVDLRVDPQALTLDASIDQLREQGFAARKTPAA